jgi:hypothetical protein
MYKGRLIDGELCLVAPTGKVVRLADVTDMLLIHLSGVNQVA